MRVITGTARGRKLIAPEGLDVRPTKDSVKEAIFSAIQFETEGSVGVRDDAVGFDQAVGEGRGHAEDDRGGVAAGVRHKARLGNVGSPPCRRLLVIV